jgi:hypothetical protein
MKSQELLPEHCQNLVARTLPEFSGSQELLQFFLFSLKRNREAPRVIISYQTKLLVAFILPCSPILPLLTFWIFFFFPASFVASHIYWWLPLALSYVNQLPPPEPKSDRDFTTFWAKNPASFICRVTGPPRNICIEISLGTYVATSHPVMPDISTKRSSTCRQRNGTFVAG